LTTRWGSLTLVLEIGCRTLSAGQPATSRGFQGYAPWLTREGGGRGGSPFCPLGAPFQVGAVTMLAQNSERPICEEEKRTVRRRIYGGVTSFIGSVCWWTAAYKYPVVSPTFFLPLSALLPLLSCCLISLAISRARAPPRAVANPPSSQPRCL